MKLYKYVGSKDILTATEGLPKGKTIHSRQDVISWIRDTKQKLDYDDSVIATFIIDKTGLLVIADRHSEHVACAGRESVLAAGEITFELIEDEVVCSFITNQSTGYCPEPESWPLVEKALNNAGIKHPVGFTIEFIFRRCETCGAKNIVKENWYFCLECDSKLPSEWNLN